MSKNFPTKYFFVFTDSAKNEIHKNRIISGLRIALTIVMEELDVTVLLLEEGASLGNKHNEPEEIPKASKNNENVNMDPFELMEGLVSFGSKVITCQSSLKVAGMTEEDLMEGIEILTLYNAILLIDEADKVLTF